MSESRGKVEITTGTKGEFELTASLLLLTEDGEDWIDSIYDAEGDDAVEQCVDFAEQNGYEIVNQKYLDRFRIGGN